MRRLILLFGALVGIGAGTFLAPASAYDTTYLNVKAQVTTRGQERLQDGGSYTELPCSNAVRQAVCDVIVSETPQTVIVGNATRNVTITVRNQP